MEALRSQTEYTPTTGKSSRAPKRGAQWEAVVREQLNGMWAVIAMPLAIVNAVDCQIFTERAPKITEALIHLAQAKHAFRKFLLTSSEKMIYSEIIIAVLPIIVLIGVNHKAIPAFLAIPFGGMPIADSEQNSAAGNAFSIFDLFSAGMETGGTLDPDRADGEREDNDST